MRALWLTCLVALVAVYATRAAELSDKDLSEARKLYTAKCAKCHKFYDPTKYSDADWQMWMGKMSKKARLKPSQSELLSRYLETFRTPGGTNAPPEKH